MCPVWLSDTWKNGKKIVFVIVFIFGVLSNLEVVLNHGGPSRFKFSSSFGPFSFCEFILYINFVVQRATAFKFGKIFARSLLIDALRRSVATLYNVVLWSWTLLRNLEHTGRHRYMLLRIAR